MNHDQAQLPAAAEQFSGDTTSTSAESSSSSSSSTATTTGSKGDEGVGALDGNGARGILPAWMRSVIGQATKQSGSVEMAFGKHPF